MNGGIGMYIHAYQIDNVLNVYRKQLSQKTKVKAHDTTPAPSTLDRVKLSHESQRQSIIDQVSADIVQRVSQYVQENRFEEVLESVKESRNDQQQDSSQKKEAEFSYTLIDENNYKRTNTLQFNNGGPLINKTGQQDQETEDKA
jgi:hypothetical protein